MAVDAYNVNDTATHGGYYHPRGRRRLADVAEQVLALKTPIMIVLALGAPLPLPLLVDSSETRCAYVVIAMAILWVTEAIPIPVTALLPVILFPVMGVLTAVDVANSYMGNTSLLFIGGLMVAIAVEESGLHRRIALGVMRFVGSDPKWVMMGLMLPTWFLSMWISNTATASMMIPIVEAILTQFKAASNSEGRPRGGSVQGRHVDARLSLKSDSVDVSVKDDAIHVTSPAPLDKQNEHQAPPSGSNGIYVVDSPGFDNDGDDDKADADEDDECDKAVAADYKRLCKGFSLCIAYAANVGGIATLTGTPPNLVFAGQADLYFRKLGGESGVSFLRWMLMAFPLSLLMLLLCWAWLAVVYTRGTCRKQAKQSDDPVKTALHNAYRGLGKVTMAEVQTLICFIVLASLWLFRDPRFLPGWSNLFNEGYTSDSTAAVFVSLLFFILPTTRPAIFCWRRKDEVRQKPVYTPLLTWPVAQAKMPWGIIILLGGGFALAKGCKFSGLSDWFGEQLSTFRGTEPWLINLVITIAVAMATEITSNTATATLLMPIMAELAIRLKVNPLYFMSSAALATSFAFMLPVATPANAIVFSHGHLRIVDMAAVGSVMNIIAVSCLTLAVNTWGSAIFGFLETPEVFRLVNITSIMSEL
ncbi:solute carrier family 13 member 5-like [Pomacea canaliculata]|uniref:solute carrier family 13 member 5-like n=1 Tax=Pomacea canaliculata TaxID=400727 RepID=UPI000D738AF1|nr:solute carrier family 13 member 5-like [Pomacea canaliculata]XP_025089960.1 solute carrier family 13 member 5-like [Pomacea canaliculata]